MPLSLSAEADLQWLCSSVGLSLIVASTFVLYAAAITVYRLTWHPLADFPGPRIARATYLYELWFDVILKGRFTREVSRLHEIYGPIVRINPDEIHFNDPSFVDTIYAHGRARARRDKAPHYLAGMPWCRPKASFGTADHDHHRLRRAPISKYFSRSRILKFEGLFHENTKRLCDKLLSYGDEPFEVAAAFSCLTTDTLVSYCFGHGLGNLDRPGWKPTFKGTIDNITSLSYLCRYFKLLAGLADWMPLYVCRCISSDVGSLVGMIRVTIPQLVIRAGKTYRSDGHLTFPQAILESNLPPSEKVPKRLISETTAVVLGGTHSVSMVLSIITYHLLANPNLLERLRTELKATLSEGDGQPTWVTLEKLPYLSAIVLEGLRLMYGVASRIPVVVPDEELVYQVPSEYSSASKQARTCYKIPRGTVIGISAYAVHMNPTLFPNPSHFLPDRWFDEQGQRNRSLERHLLSFSKGNRQCVGMQLANCELYIATANLALRVWPQMSLYRTTIEDVEYDHDQLLSVPKAGSKGVRVVMH
ncbi:Trichodiene oxygenase [Tolypocladium capitatum]|uniref:Trichodiene oxygenase n=1 Tax=Tolypocladium capitatum TaxID=45235 RepID=A0A2K3QQZ5_9HYPO|nr:Trichodiene oxygenase [Tolypocladium capitatum]